MARRRFNWRAYRKKRAESGNPVRKYKRHYWYLSPDLTKCWLTTLRADIDPYKKKTIIKSAWLSGPGALAKGDRVYFAWRGYIRGWAPIMRVISVKEPWYCDQLDHTFHVGSHVVCRGPIIPCTPAPQEPFKFFKHSHPWGETPIKVPKGKKAARDIRRGKIKPAGGT